MQTSHFCVRSLSENRSPAPNGGSARVLLELRVTQCDVVSSAASEFVCSVERREGIAAWAAWTILLRPL